MFVTITLVTKLISLNTPSFDIMIYRLIDIVTPSCDFQMKVCNKQINCPRQLSSFFIQPFVDSRNQTQVRASVSRHSLIKRALGQQLFITHMTILFLCYQSMWSDTFDAINVLTRPINNTRNGQTATMLYC